MTVGNTGVMVVPPGLANPLDSRSCGGCTVCCVRLHIATPELSKPADVPCQHLAANGCGIYETRAPICRSWHCVWRIVLALPEACRPDRCGVLFTQESNPRPFSPFAREYIQGRALRSTDDFNDPAAQLAIQRLVACEAYPVWLVADGQPQHCVFPDLPLAEAILYPETTPHRHLLDKAAELRRKWDVPLPGARELHDIGGS